MSESTLFLIVFCILVVYGFIENARGNLRLQSREESRAFY